MNTLSSGQDLTSMFVVVSLIMVAICVGAFVLIKWVFPRFVQAPLYRKKGPIRILARYALEPRVAVYVLKIGKKNLVVGAAERGLSLLAQLEDSELSEEWK